LIFGARRSDGPARLIGDAQVTLPPPAVDADLRGLATYIETNNQIEECCVGDALEDAHHIVTRGQSGRASPLSFWRGARVRERIRKGDPILNQGCQPADAIDYAIEIGPYTRDALDDDPGAMNSMETWPEATKCVPFAPDSFVAIPTGDVETWKRWIAAAQQAVRDPSAPPIPAVTFGMDVFPSYQAIQSWDIWHGPTSSEASLGGHYQCGSAGCDAEACWIWGSWPNFGAGGLVRISWGWLAGNAYDTYVMRKGPKLP
jgi:hypothetical protein